MLRGNTTSNKIFPENTIYFMYWQVFVNILVATLTNSNLNEIFELLNAVFSESKFHKLNVIWFGVYSAIKFFDDNKMFNIRYVP